MSDKVLTIGVAAYNVADVISNCLDSLLTTEVSNDIEVLVVNDGSIDNIKSVVSTYEKKYPGNVRLINKKNGGHGSTINKTIEEATGKYLKMVDADDSVEENGLVDLIKRLKQTDADIVMSPYYRVNIDSKRKTLVGYLSSTQKSWMDNKLVNLKDIYNELLVAMHSLTYKTSLLRKSNYRIDEHCFYVDVEYSMYYFLKAESILLLKRPVYNYNIGSTEQSININIMRKRRKQHLRVAKSMIDFYEKERNNLSPYRNSFFENNIVNMILVNEYKLIMSLSSGEVSKQELVQFDNYLKESSPILYKEVVVLNNSKKIKLLNITRKVHFHGYNMVHKLYKKQLTTHI